MFCSPLVAKTRDDFMMHRAVDMGAAGLCILAALQIYAAQQSLERPIALTFFLISAFAFGLAAAIMEGIASCCDVVPSLLEKRIERVPHALLQWGGVIFAVVGGAMLYMGVFGVFNASVRLARWCHIFDAPLGFGVIGLSLAAFAAIWIIFRRNLKMEMARRTSTSCHRANGASKKRR